MGLGYKTKTKTDIRICCHHINNETGLPTTHGIANDEYSQRNIVQDSKQKISRLTNSTVMQRFTKTHPVDAITNEILEAYEERICEYEKQYELVLEKLQHLSDPSTIFHRSISQLHGTSNENSKELVRMNTGFWTMKHMEAHLFFLCNGNFEVLSSLHIYHGNVKSDGIVLLFIGLFGVCGLEFGFVSTLLKSQLSKQA